MVYENKDEVVEGGREIVDDALGELSCLASIQPARSSSGGFFHFLIWPVQATPCHTQPPILQYCIPPSAALSADRLDRNGNGSEHTPGF